MRLSDGHVITARQVVSGLGYRVTESLLPNAQSSVSTATKPPDCATKQSLGFVMANIGLRGSPEKLGISVANVWTQPAAASNGYDAMKGIDDFMLDPLGVPLEMVPAGITFPSLKVGACRTKDTYLTSPHLTSPHPNPQGRRGPQRQWE